MSEQAAPITIFLVGITGDLSKKKVLPALYELFQSKYLGGHFQVVGIARSEFSREGFVEFLLEQLKPTDMERFQQFAQCCTYVAGDVTDESTFAKVQALHNRLDNCGNHLWYLATLPILYSTIIRNMSTTGVHKSRCGWTKILLEKPFGIDLQSAQELNSLLLSEFEEAQIYRIDHFLGKETIQNLLVFRFANGLFENLWSKDYIDHIQIIKTETMGIAGREVFYDQTGAVRDVVQNHLLQMVAMTLMEPPASLAAKDIRQQRDAVLQSLTPLDLETISMISRYGQYQAGQLMGENVIGYRQEHPSLQNSTTETAVALKINSQLARWQGVPIYLFTGKRFDQTVTEISIQFKEPINSMFVSAGCAQAPNVLTLRIDPNEGVVLRLHAKKTGLKLELDEVLMEFCYKTSMKEPIIDAYVKLIYDAVVGDPTLFLHADGIEAAWAFVEPLLKFQAQPGFSPDPYPAGSFGPTSFASLLLADGRSIIQHPQGVCQL